VSPKKRKKRIFPHPDYQNVRPIPIDEKFGIVADTHLGSKFEALRELNEMYDILYESGVKQVFHAGDLTDGYLIYRGQLSDQHKIGYEDQAKWVIEKYPRKPDIKTYVIAGNHDTSYLKRQGADIVNYVASYRDDIEYVGPYYARFLDGISLDLVHPSGTIPYAVSYGAQKYLRNQPPSYHPDIIIFGHRHIAWFGYYQEVYCIEAGCFMKPTDYLIRMGSAGSIGGWILEIKRKGRKIKKVKAEWVQL